MREYLWNTYLVNEFKFSLVNLLIEFRQKYFNSGSYNIIYLQLVLKLYQFQFKLLKQTVLRKPSIKLKIY